MVERSPVTENPFVWGPPIREPRYFFGRQREIQTIVSRLKGAVPASSAVIGGRRIGKTSLLNILGHPHTLEENGLTDEYVVINLYCPLTGTEQNQPGDVETEFWRLILQGMCERIGSRIFENAPLASTIDPILQQPHITFGDFREVIQTTYKAGLKVVLLFDEFQNVVGNEALPLELFGGLRYLTQSYNLAFVTASGRNLQALATTIATATSPFWNVFTNVYLGPLSEEEAHSLVTGYTQKTGISFTAEDLKYIMRVSGGHPSFLQIICGCVFRAYRDGMWGGEIDQERAQRDVEHEFLRQAEPHFAEFWKESSGDERRVLTILAYRMCQDRGGNRRRHESAPQPRSGLKALYERSLVIRAENGDYEIFSPLFAEWIRQQPSDAEEKVSAELERAPFVSLAIGCAFLALILVTLALWTDFTGLLWTGVSAFAAAMALLVPLWIRWLRRSLRRD